MGNYLKYSLPLLSLFLSFLLFEPSPYSPPFPIFLSVIAPNFSSSTYARPTASNQRAASPADKLLADGDSRPSTEAHQRPWCNDGLREETGCLLQPAEVSSLCVHVCVCVCIPVSHETCRQTASLPFTVIQATFSHSRWWRLKIFAVLIQ